MEFSIVANLDQRKRSDALVLPFWKGKNGAESAFNLTKLDSLVSGPIETGDFKGKEGEVVFTYSSSKHEQRIMLVGLGEKDKVTVEKLRRSYSNVTKASIQKKLKEINLIVPILRELSEEDRFRGIAEGLLLPNYVFAKNRPTSTKDEPIVLLEKVNFIGANKNELAVAEKYAEIMQGVYFARDLVNGNADDVTPEYLVKVAEGLEKTLSHVKTTIFNKKRLEKEKMGLILAVSRGSYREPALIFVEYKGNPKSKDHTVLVGKGVTYDTGGLNIKPTGSMETMRCDMGGAAAVLGTLYTAATLGLKVNVTAVVPTVENSIGSMSYKPGDVYQSYAGKTVEIGNTDAEGRLILADALAYVSKHLKPTRIIDVATLTGAIDIALGPEASGLMSNDDALADALIRSGSDTYDRVWRMPMYEEYREQLKSDVADIKNIGGRAAGSITAAHFLQEFVDKTPWAHLDIASTAFLSEIKRYHPKLATGVGVRLLVDFLEHV